MCQEVKLGNFFEEATAGASLVRNKWAVVGFFVFFLFLVCFLFVVVVFFLSQYLRFSHWLGLPPWGLY